MVMSGDVTLGLIILKRCLRSVSTVKRISAIPAYVLQSNRPLRTSDIDFFRIVCCVALSGESFLLLPN